MYGSAGTVPGATPETPTMQRIPGVRRLPSGEPDVTQTPINGWDISYNPDDNMFHVANPRTLETFARYSDMRNARQWARAHKAPHAE